MYIQNNQWFKTKFGTLIMFLKRKLNSSFGTIPMRNSELHNLGRSGTSYIYIYIQAMLIQEVQGGEWQGQRLKT